MEAVDDMLGRSQGTWDRTTGPWRARDRRSSAVERIGHMTVLLDDALGPFPRQFMPVHGDQQSVPDSVAPSLFISQPRSLHAEPLRWMPAGAPPTLWRSVGQIHLYNNPILKISLTLGDVNYMLLGHWGTTPGLNFVHGFTRIAGNLSGPTASGRNRPL